MATTEQPTDLRADPAMLSEIAAQLRRRPGPLELTPLDPAAAGATATAAAIAAFTRSYDGAAAVLSADDAAAATHLHDVAEHYRTDDTFRAHT